MLKFLVSDDVRAVILRKFFVFKIIPIINVDGVYRGHFRYDSNGLNMNRHYANPNIKQQPEIFAIRKLMLYFDNEKRVKYYFDLHGHVTQRGLFFYGNNNDFLKQIENILLPTLLELNSPHFTMEASNFSAKSMQTKEKGDAYSKEGTGRVFFSRECDIIHSYTVEASYFRGKRTNDIQQLPRKPVLNDYLKGQFGSLKIDQFEMLELNEGDFDESCYTIKMYEKMGIDILITLLDYEELNPFSRLFINENSLDEMRKTTATKLLEENQFKSNINIQITKDMRQLKKFPSILDKLKRKQSFSSKLPVYAPKRSNTVAKMQSQGKKTAFENNPNKLLQKQLTSKITVGLNAEREIKSLRVGKLKPLKEV